MPHEILSTRHAIRYNDGLINEFDDSVVIEEIITLYLNGTKHLSLVATADSLTELGAGYFIASGTARHIDSVRVDGLNIYVESADTDQKDCTSGILSSSGGISATFSDNNTPLITTKIPITPDEIFSIRESLNVDIWSKTGGLHCAVLYNKHAQAALFQDIGRHNAVDKAIGYMALHNLAPEDCVIGCTGRQPFGMVAKVARAKIPIIISRAAATTAGISLAETSGITLICFTREKRFTIYSHPERVLIDPPHQN